VGSHSWPSSIVTVTPKSVETRTGAKGKYAYLGDATIEQNGKEPYTRTVMAFSAVRDQIRGKLRAGRKVKLAVQHDGAVLKAVGFPLPNAKAAND